MASATAAAAGSLEERKEGSHSLSRHSPPEASGFSIGTPAFGGRRESPTNSSGANLVRAQAAHDGAMGPAGAGDGAGISFFVFASVMAALRA